MATAAQTIIDKVVYDLKDSKNNRWPLPDLLSYLNDGQEAIVLLKPDVNAVIESVQLVVGSIQDLPSTAIQMLEATYNMGTDGTTVGDPISIVDRAIMDACYPGWRVAAAATSVKHVIYDPKKLPKKYWIYPKSDGSNYIEIVTSKIPTACTALGSNIALGDEYKIVLYHYVMARAFSKNAETADAAKAQSHITYVVNALDVQEQSEDIFKPKRSQGGLI